MKNLIVYFSHSSNNKQLVVELKSKLNCDIIQIKEVNKRSGFTILMDVMFRRNPAMQEVSTDIKMYDHIIFVAPVWAGRIASPLKSYILQHKRDIHSYSFITVCSGVSGQKKKIEMELTHLAAKSPMVVTELWINDLLPEDRKNKIKYVTPYRVKPNEFIVFEQPIQKHIDTIASEFSRG